MHEMSVALSVVDQVERAARERGAHGVEQVRVEVGELAGVVSDALDFCFDLACAGTVLEGARLLTEAVPGRAHCAPCARTWATGMPPDLVCPGCRSAATELVAGRELTITEVRWSADDAGDRTTASTSPSPSPSKEN
ncbi:hydrogenase maturation nickel metallochaperone HypA [Streptomyces sp. NPDC003717]|uniref:hydrogenase maturation nickel metallochaperone HypA n=1 Tax=Streptomyces sp. NPDC003717 TaxID=3154276 RepID=UPI0033A553AA